jgi:hypothetical protein
MVIEAIERSLKENDLQQTFGDKKKLILNLKYG